MIDKVMADLGHGRMVAAADAGRAHDTHAGPDLSCSSRSSFSRRASRR